ncbi:MAG: HupE/UreJ family protein, partial [Hyphomicrobium sp.]
MRKDLSLFLIALIIVVEILFVLAGPAAAHKPSDSYLTLTVNGDSVGGRWDIALRDLDHAIGLDQNQDGSLTWGEVRRKHREIEAYALARLSLQSDGNPCRLSARPQLVENHSDGAYTMLPFTADCGGPVDRLAVRYSLFFDLDPLHRGLLQLRGKQSSTSAVLAPGSQIFTWRAGAEDTFQNFLTYGRDGVRHILIGFDHILFLLCLLLPVGLRRVDGTWQHVSHWREATWPVIHTVTAFTIAHSVTLCVNALGLVSLPSWLVESVIAASIVAAAFNNIWPVVTRRLWLVAFGFGLIHGFGFASVLVDLGLPRDALVASLLGFNLGIEAGQLAIISAALPVI